MDLTLVILAAGIGSRYGGIKQLDTIGPNGETLMDYSIHDAINAGFNKVVFIIRKDLQLAFDNQYKERFRGRIEISYVYQDEFNIYEDQYTIQRSKPWGTGHAQLSTKDAVKSPYVILNADDYYGTSVYQIMADTLKENQDENMVFMMGYQLANTLSEYGTVSRGLCKVDDDNLLIGVTELTEISREGHKIIYKDNGDTRELMEADIVSMNFWGFYPSIYKEMDALFKSFLEKNHSDPKAEFYIPTFVDILLKQNIIKVRVLPTDEIWFGVTYQDDKQPVKNEIMELIKKGRYPQKLG
ncbi:sugar phosphate nucleotidyltransferase [Bacteroidota bacterium]